MTIFRPSSPFNLLIVLAISSSSPHATAFTTPSSSSSSSWRQWSSSRNTKTTSFPHAFIITTTTTPPTTITSLFSTTATTTTTTEGGFIDTELRGAAMKLHTKSQAPREGQRPEQQQQTEPYTPTHGDYLQFLVDSQHVYATFENLVLRTSPSWRSFRDTGLERTVPLEEDINYVMTEYRLAERPPVGEYGLSYADEIRRLNDEDGGSVPELMCHYYNWYFAHTAGGRMIGKKMSQLLLNGTTLAFYKWDDLNKIKTTVKNDIETMVSSWTREEKDRCVAQTEAAFRLGGGINRYLSQKH